MAFLIDPDKAAYDFDNRRVNFYAESNGERVLCAVTEEAIQDLTQSHEAQGPELVELFKANSGIFSAIAEELHGFGRREPDGYLVIKSSDLSE